MPNYTKLFSSIITSTIWTEDDKTRILWITMLALADKNGEVHASVPGLARVAGIDLESCEKGLECLQNPDPYSRTEDNEGRRIAKIEGGWELLNHAKYRRMASKEDAKQANAERNRRYRARKSGRDAPPSRVTVRDAPETQDRDIAEAEAEAEEEREPRSKTSSPPTENTSTSAKPATTPPPTQDDPDFLDEAAGERKPLCSLKQAISYAPVFRMTPEEATTWWHARNANGWMKGTKGGVPTRIGSWQSDMLRSRDWIQEELSKQRQATKTTTVDQYGI